MNKAPGRSETYKTNEYPKICAKIWGMLEDELIQHDFSCEEALHFLAHEVGRLLRMVILHVDYDEKEIKSILQSTSETIKTNIKNGWIERKLQKNQEKNDSSPI